MKIQTAGDRRVAFLRTIVEHGGDNTGELCGQWIEARAGRIGDPVDKLRYLQRAMQAAEQADRPMRRWHIWRPLLLAACVLLPVRRWHVWRPLLLTACVLLPVPTVSHVFAPPAPPPPEIQPADDASVPDVWLVEESPKSEVYSNGLRIDLSYESRNHKRLYPIYGRRSLDLEGWSSRPVGIVYHTTESNQAPFNVAHNGRLRNVSKWLLDYIRRKHAYHYLVDRFGRVHRVVPETDSANHAGYSIWADREHVYVNLNHSFLGISFETETKESARGAPINKAQVHAAKVLTQMLRNRYGISLGNCVTHAQVSVFSRAMTVGNHTDWAANFPFQEIGLRANYSRPPASIAVFGFRHGPELRDVIGPELRKGIARGDEIFRELAAFRGEPVARFRADREKRYREILEVMKVTVESQEKGS